MLVESGGDNLTATFSPALVDAQIFVLDVAGGGDVARKGGPGIARADLLVVNKTDLAPYVGVDADLMQEQGREARDGRPVIGLSRTDPASVAALRAWVLGDARGPPQRPPRAGRPRARWRRTSTPNTATPRAPPTRTTAVWVSTHTDVRTARVELWPERRPQPAGAAPRAWSPRGWSGTTRRAPRSALLATTATLLGGDTLRLAVEVGPGLRLDLRDVAGTVAYHGRGLGCVVDASPARARRRHPDLGR